MRVIAYFVLHLHPTPYVRRGRTCCLLSVYWTSQRESLFFSGKGLSRVTCAWPPYLGQLSWQVAGCGLRPGARVWGAGTRGNNKFQDGLCSALTRPGPLSRISEPFQHNLTNNSLAPARSAASDHLARGESELHSSQQTCSYSENATIVDITYPYCKTEHFW